MKLIALTTLAALAASLLFAGRRTEASLIALPGNLGPGGVTGVDLIGNTVTVGNETFGFVSATPNSSTTISPSDVIVTALTTVIGGVTTPFGVEFSGAFLATAPPAADLTIRYTVTSGGPFSSVNLSDNAATTGTGLAQVVERVFANNGGAPGLLLGQATLTGPGAISINLSNPSADLFIEKDIIYSSGAAGTANFSVIDQTFPQSVPEPSAALMFGTGLLCAAGCVWLVKRRTRA